MDTGKAAPYLSSASPCSFACPHLRLPDRQFNRTHPLSISLIITVTLARFLFTTPLLAQTAWTLNGNSVVAGEFLGTTNPMPLVIKANNTEWARLTSSGELGIGTTAPATRLHVHAGIIRITGPNSAGGPMAVFGGTAGGTAPHGEWGIEYVESGSARGLNFWRPALSSGAGFANHVLFLSDDNRVGINTDNPAAPARLVVNGKTLIGDPNTVTLPGPYNLYVQNGILTDGVKVATVNSGSWADHVFAPGYTLRSLTEVESFIQANRHLPDVPSGAEVESSGLDLVEINATLLQKIEELTLYTIDLNKRIESQDARLRAMEGSVAIH